MNKSIVIIGIGEMAGVFARGLLRTGYPVIPATRDTSLAQLASEVKDPAAVIVGVAENDLHDVLGQIPEIWHDRLVLLQNELLPRDWQQYKINNPTVISVWFEKKKGQDFKVLIASPVFGPKASIIHDALTSLTIPAIILKNETELESELVIKNVYILTTNITGLALAGTTPDLTVDIMWNLHRELATKVANDVIAIQQHLTGKTFVHENLIDGMVKAIHGDTKHKCMGRSAPARLARAIAIADDAGLAVPTLREIADKN